MHKPMELTLQIVHVLVDLLCNRRLDRGIYWQPMHSRLDQVWLRSHHMIEEELVQLLVLQFESFSLRDSPGNSGITTVVDPKLIDVSALFPVVALVFVIRMIRILGSEITKIMQKLRIESVMRKQRVKVYMNA